MIGTITPSPHMRFRSFTMTAGRPAPIDSIDIPVQGMSCASCVGRVEKAIRSVEGVTAANVNLATERAHVEFAPSGVDPSAVAEAIRRVGYEPSESTIDLKIDGMTCASCVSRVEKALKRVPGVIGASVNLATERASVRYLGTGNIVARLADAVEQTGYEAKPIRQEDGQADRERADREAEIASLRQAVLVATILTLPVFVLEMGSHFIPAVHDWVMGTFGHRNTWYAQFALPTLVLFGPGLPFFRKGIPALLRGSPDMNSLVVLGTSAAY